MSVRLTRQALSMIVHFTYQERGHWLDDAISLRALYMTTGSLVFDCFSNLYPKYQWTKNTSAGGYICWNTYILGKKSLIRAWQYQGHVFKYRLQGPKSFQIIVSTELKAFLLKKVDFWGGGTHFDEFGSEIPFWNQEFSFFECHLVKNQLFSIKMLSIQ